VEIHSQDAESTKKSAGRIVLPADFYVSAYEKPALSQDVNGSTDPWRRGCGRRGGLNRGLLLFPGLFCRGFVGFLHWGAFRGLDRGMHQHLICAGDTTDSTHKTSPL
jgi:hypothetical protein